MTERVSLCRTKRKLLLFIVRTASSWWDEYFDLNKKIITRCDAAPVGCRRHEGLTAQVRDRASRVLAPAPRALPHRVSTHGRGRAWRGLDAARGAGLLPCATRGPHARAREAVPEAARPLLAAPPLPRELVGGSARGSRAAAFGRETATLGWPRICGLRPEVRPERSGPSSVPTARAQLPVPPGPGRLAPSSAGAPGPPVGLEARAHRLAGPAPP